MQSGTLFSSVRSESRISLRSLVDKEARKTIIKKSPKLFNYKPESSKIYSLNFNFPSARFRIALSIVCSASSRITFTGLKVEHIHPFYVARAPLLILSNSMASGCSLEIILGVEIAVQENDSIRCSQS